MAWAKKTIGNYPAGKQASAVIALLWRAQEQNAGWLSKPAMEYIGQMLDMAFIRVYEVATFYTMFQLSPVGRKAHIQVCGTTPCMLRGAEDLKKVCQRKIHHDPHHVSADGNFSWEEAECLGACVNAPMVQIWKDTYEDLTPESFEKLLDDLAAGKSVKPGPQNGRQLSAPEGALTSLTDKSLYSGNRTFKRIEAPPPPPPHRQPLLLRLQHLSRWLPPRLRPKRLLKKLPPKSPWQRKPPRNLRRPKRLRRRKRESEPCSLTRIAFSPISTASMTGALRAPRSAAAGSIPNPSSTRAVTGW